MVRLTGERAIWLGVFAALMVTAVIGFQPLLHLDRLFLPDDTYYTLSISRNIAAGLGPTTDGVIPTSGFQPLIALLQVPAFWFSDDPRWPVVWTIAISGLFGVIGVGLLGRVLVQSGARPVTVLLATIFAATAPAVLSNSLNGLETSLAATIGMMAALVAGGVTRDAGPGRLILLGVLCGLALLARIDTAFLVLLIGLLALWRVGFGRAAMVAAAATTVVLPWWVWCQINFGTPIPESGRAVHQLVLHYRDLGLDLPSAAFYGLVILAEIGGGDAGTNLGIVLASGGLLAMVWVLSGRRPVTGLHLLVGAAMMLAAFYVFYLPVFWFFDRYFLPVWLAMIGAVALAFDRLATRPGVTWRLPVAIAALLVVFNLPGLARLHGQVAPENWNSFSGVKGYAAVAQDIIAKLPQDAVLGAMQSGALGYFAGAGQRVVNLDGVVSGPAHTALQNRNLAAFMQGENIGYFADWRVNRDMFAAFAGIPDPLSVLQEPQPMAPQQAAEFTIYRTVWP